MVFSMTQVARATKGARDSCELHCPNSYLFELLFFVQQPIAEEPFRFETELDDLPKEKLKGIIT